MRRPALLLLTAFAIAGCDAFTPFEPGAETAAGNEEVTEPDPTTATIAYENRGSYEIIRVYATPCSDADWGNGTGVSIYPGESYERTVTAPGCYDLAAWWDGPDGTVYTYSYDLQAQAGQTYRWRTP